MCMWKDHFNYNFSKTTIKDVLIHQSFFQEKTSIWKYTNFLSSTPFARRKFISQDIHLIPVIWLRPLAHQNEVISL